MRTLAVSSLVLLASLLPREGSATCVNPSGMDGCFASIQAAVDAAADFETIEIAPGVYSEVVAITQREGLTLQGAGADETRLDPGGIEIRHSSKTTITDLAIENGDGSGILVARLLGLPRKARALTTIERVRIRGHGWAGINHRYGSVVLRDSTIADNEVLGVDLGGDADPFSNAHYYVAYLSVIGSTIVSNGTGIGSYQSQVKVIRSTISGHFGPALSTVGPSRSPTARIVHSTLLGLTRGYAASIFGSILEHVDLVKLQSRGFNVVGTFSPPDTRMRATDRVGVDPMLAPLADNGGPTETHALLPGSPALDAILSGGICRAAPDQRGVERTAPCDIGAFEAP
jgi:hypothetical protein